MAEKYSITKKEEVYNLLKNKRNFEYMSEPLLRQLINVMKVVRFREEKILIKQGAENAFCYIIIRGSISVYVDGKFLYKLRRTGDVFGEISFVTQSISTATIKAEKDLGVIVISYNIFNKLKNVELALWLARVIGEKLVRTSKIKSEEAPTAIKEPVSQQETSPAEIKSPAVIETVDIEPIEKNTVNESEAISLDEMNETSEMDQPSESVEAFAESTSPSEEESGNLEVESSQEAFSETTELESIDDIVEISEEPQDEPAHSENSGEEIEEEPIIEEIIDLESNASD